MGYRGHGGGTEGGHSGDIGVMLVGWRGRGSTVGYRGHGGGTRGARLGYRGHGGGTAAGGGWDTGA